MSNYIANIVNEMDELAEMIDKEKTVIIISGNAYLHFAPQIVEIMKNRKKSRKWKIATAATLLIPGLNLAAGAVLMTGLGLKARSISNKDILKKYKINFYDEENQEIVLIHKRFISSDTYVRN